MKRLLVSLDDEMYEALRTLAFEKNTQMAKLVRFAIEEAFEDEIDGIIGEARLKEHLADPSGSITIQEFMKEHNIEPSRRDSAKGSSRTRRVAS